MKTALFLFVVFCVAQSWACSCINSPFCQKFESASDVIRGKVNRQLPSTTLQNVFEVSVTTVFKTKNNLAVHSKISVSTNPNSAACGFHFQAGEEYVVFLNGVSTNLCSGTALWSSVTTAQRTYLRAPRACGSCSTVLCPPRATCEVDDLGVASCAAGCNLACPKGQVCELREVLCIRAPCPPIATCVNPCANKVCGDFQTCHVYAPTGEAYCADSCAHFPCPDGQVCQLQDVTCIRAPCPPRAVCVDPCQDTVCGRNQICQVYPVTGEAYCADTCDGYPCPDGQVCKLQQVQCIRAPCPPVATCSAAANPCAAVQCSTFQVCQVDDTTGEAYCADTCEGRTCPIAAQRCELVQVQCVRAPCPPVAQCSCPAACIDLYDPVCGSDGQTYGNSCRLSVANCNLLAQDPTATPITVVSPGECPPAPTGCLTVRCSAGYVCQVNSEGHGYCAASCDSYPACPTGQVCHVSPPDVCTTGADCAPVASCVACPEACIAIFQPVCGTDGETYGNACELQRHNCALAAGAQLVAVAHDGACCPQLCPALIAPVCGSDGTTYHNECELRRTNCGANPPVVVVHEGNC